MRRLFVLSALVLAAPAWAHERPVASGGAAIHQTQASGHSPLDCYCRAQGRIFAPGERICLRTGGEPRMAECRMEINVMSWGLTDQPCPES